MLRAVADLLPSKTMPDPFQLLTCLVFNRAPDCLLLSCGEAESASTPTQSRELILSLTFGEQAMPFLQGRIQFALKGGRLKLTLTRGKFEPNNRALAPYGKWLSISPDEAIWQLRPAQNFALLEGKIDTASLGKSIPIEGEVRGAIAVEICAADLTLTQVENLWHHDLHPNAHGVVERAICLTLRDCYLAPALSGCNIGKTEVVPGKDIPVQFDEYSLRQAIERLYQDGDRDLIHLAQLAALDPLEDLAGGNFTATDLNAINLAGADLHQANFRGSTLTDADLSEANLSGARLVGADLSGAYLGNTNLSASDCRRASFALANLMGADLRRANLVGANLSQVKLVGAQLQDAVFGDNSGLAPEVKRYLHEQGAIIQR